MPSFGVLPSLPTNRSLTRALRPSATQIMVVYSLATGERRRVIDADSDAEYQDHIDTLNQGEGYFLIPNSEYDAYASAYTLNAAVAAQAGFDAPFDPQLSRHIAIDQNNMVNYAIHADPTCGDYIPGHALIQDNVTDIGVVYVAAIAAPLQQAFITNLQATVTATPITASPVDSSTS